MVVVNRIFVKAIVILLFIQTKSHAKKSYKCPLDFEIAYSTNKGVPICYKLKGPEPFSDNFKDCAGNLYTLKMLENYDIPPTDQTLWTEYKNLYPEGPFVDWSHTQTTGEPFLFNSEVNTKLYEAFETDTVCVAKDPVIPYVAYNCADQNYRYCFVKPYSEEGDDSEGCEKFRGSSRFSSPLPTCMAKVTPVGGGTVRATWRQAEELCEKRSASLLNKGWIYSNHPYFESFGLPAPMYPFGVIFNTNHTDPRFWSSDGGYELDEGTQNFLKSRRGEEIDITSDMIYGALRDPYWYTVNSSYVFYDVLCEKNIQLKNVTLLVKVDEENKIVLSVSEPVNESKIYCYTDSVSYNAEPIKITYDKSSNVYVLSPKDDGYYWCFQNDSYNYVVSESNKALFIREKQSLMYIFSVKFKIKDQYEFDNYDKLYKLLRKKLAEYIYYTTKYIKTYGDFNNSTSIEQTLKSFKSSGPKVDVKDIPVIRNVKIRRLYIDKKTALAHVEVNKSMRPVYPGYWGDLQVFFMRPVYYCNETTTKLETIPSTPLGSTVTTSDCENYTCIGNFNEGVQWFITKAEDCVITTFEPSTVMIQSKVTLNMPTISPLRPEVPTRELTRDGEESSEETTQQHPTTPSNSTTIPRPIPENITTTFPTTIIVIDPTTEPVITDSVTTDVITRPTYPTWPPHPTWPPQPTTPPTTKPVPTENPTEPPTTFPPAPSPRPPPEEQLQQVMDDLGSLLNNDTAPVMIESINRPFDQVDELLSESENLSIPGELLHLLDGIGSRIQLNGTEPASTVRENIALVVAEATPEDPVTGLRIAARDTDAFTDSAFEILRDGANSSHLQTEKSEVVVQLPMSVAASQRRISFVVFRTDRAFQGGSEHYTVNSRVLSINVENLTHFETGEVIDIHLSPMRNVPEANQSRACAYWHFLENGTGYWSQDGCTFIASTEEGALDTCRCDHLTHFAEILIPRTSFPEAHEKALELLSIIGCCISIIGLMLVGLTAIMFRSWRRDFSNKIWLQLCLAILLLISCFLVIVFVDFKEYTVVCMLVGVLLHYSTLASFCWMLVAAVLSYRRLVMVFTRDASHKLLKASAFSWGAPCAVVGILLSIGPHSYAGQFEGEVPTGAFCYPTGLSLWLAVYAPIALMLVANWILFILIVRSVFASRRIQRHGDSNEALRCASVSCLLVFLFGLPWIFGLFLATNLVTVYLFTITATFQGFVLFVFFVLGNKKTRDLWLNKLKIKQTRKVPVTSSTYTNRSTGNAGWRGASAGTSSIEAKASKPRSLASPDESRFS